MSVRGKLGMAALVAALVLVFGLGRGWFRNSARPVGPVTAPAPGRYCSLLSEMGLKVEQITARLRELLG